MSVATNDRRSLYLLLSLLLFILLTPFLEHSRFGEIILIISMYVTLIPTISELNGKRILRWLTIVVGVPFMLALLAGMSRPVRPLLIADYALLMAFFGFSSVGLFTYLGKPGAITSGRVYASVSLYLMLGLFWFSLYSLTAVISPGSIVQMGAVLQTSVPRSGFLYFSLITLTTVGYGDIVPVSPAARVFSALEGATGVLYIAITVARLVAAYQRADRDRL